MALQGAPTAKKSQEAPGYEAGKVPFSLCRHCQSENEGSVFAVQALSI